MTKRNGITLQQTAFDAVLALSIIYLIAIRNSLFAHNVHTLLLLKVRAVDALFGICFVFSWHLAFTTIQQSDSFTSPRQKFFSTFRVVSVLVGITIAFIFSFHGPRLTGSTAAWIFVSLLIYTFARRVLAAHVMDLIAARDPQRVLILGSGRRASKAWRQLRTNGHRTVKFLGFIDDRAKEEMPPDVASRHVGGLDELSNILLNEVVDVVLIAMPIQSCYPIMQRAVHVAEAAGTDVVYLDDIYSSLLARNESEREIFRSLVPQQQCKHLKLTLKRACDVAGAIVGLLICLPLFAVVALVIKATDEGPVFFRQKRYGLGRRTFSMLKFRTMVVNAEALLPELEDYNEAVGPIFKMKNDPRVTRVGGILRKLSIDELPQLWNVLKGEMSLVGPRPMTQRDVSLFTNVNTMRRFSVKPGITGLWQVSGRSSVGFDRWISLDSRYIDNWSLLLDFKILFQTFNVVFRRSGAM
jgi:exopolysaccharide biosynthesis polyprenyl glycosylphosphotransferase